MTISPVEVHAGNDQEQIERRRLLQAKTGRAQDAVILPTGREHGNDALHSKSPSPNIWPTTRSCVAVRPATRLKRAGEIPVPGRRASTSAALKRWPRATGRATNRLLRATRCASTSHG